jgi:hypothetical protein
MELVLHTAQSYEPNFGYAFQICKINIWNSGPHLYGTLRSVDWWLVTDVSRLPIGSIFMVQEAQEECCEHLTTQLCRERCGQ